VLASLGQIPADRRNAWRMHKVESGEDVSSIARLFNAAPAQILAANNLTDSEVAPGSRLVIPAVYHEPAAARTAAHTVAHTGAKPVTHTSAKSTAAARNTTVHKTQPVAAKTPVHTPGIAIAQAKPAPAGLNR
jgi:spore germination protein YaaH